MGGEPGDDQASNSDEKKRRFKRICVFCGSRTGYRSSFSDATLQLGKELVIFPVSTLLSSFCLSMHSDE